MHPLAPLLARLFAAVSLLLSPALASAAPTIAGRIDPSPGPEPVGALIKLYDPVTDHVFAYGGSPTGGNGQSIVAINAATRRVTASFQMPNQFSVDIALDSAAGKLYATDYGRSGNGGQVGKILVLRTTDLVQIGSFDLPWSGAMHLAVHTGTKKAYVQQFTGAVVEVDLTTGATQTVVHTGTDRGTIAVNPQKNRLYVYFRGVYQNQDRYDIWVIDTTTRTLVAQVPVPPNLNFEYIAVSEAGDRFFVVGEESVQGEITGRLLIVDATSNTVIGQPINIGRALRWAWHDTALNAVLVSGPSGNDDNSHIWKVSMANNQVTDLGQHNQLSYSDGAFAYAAPHHTVHATAGTFPQVFTINVDTLQKQTYDVGYRPYSVAVDAAKDRVYFTSFSGSELLVADGSSRAVLARIPVGGRGGSFPPIPVAVNSSTDRVYTTSFDLRGISRFDTSVAVIDSSTNQLVTRIPLLSNSLGASTMTLAVDEAADLAYVTYNEEDGIERLAVIDGRPASPTKNTVLKTLTLPGSAAAMAFNPKNKRLYLARPVNSAKGFMVLDTTNILTSNPTVGEFPAGFNRPAAIAVNPVTNRVYVSDNDSLQVYIFDAASFGKLGSISINTPQNPYSDGVFGVAVDSTTNRLYVSDHGSFLQGTLTVIDGATNAISTLALEVGRSPHHVAVNELTHQIYVANRDGGDIAVVDDAPPPSITTSTFPLKGGKLAVSGARGAVTFGVLGEGGALTSELPTGQLLLADGTVSGTAEPGTFTFTIRVTETANPTRTAERTYTVTVPGRPNPVEITVRQVDGSELEQGKLLILEWTLKNTATTNARNVVFRIEPPIGFALQGGVNAPIFVDASGQGTGAPIDPITKKQVTIPGARSNPLLGFGADGFQLATYGVGTLLPGASQKLRATFRIAYDWKVTPFVFNFATVTTGQKPGQYPPRTMPGLSLAIAQAPPNAPRPKLGVSVTQLGAGVVLENGQEIATVGRGSSNIQGSVPKRRQNEIIYRATYHNQGNKAADFLRISVPVPENTLYVGNSAKLDDATIQPRKEKIGSQTNLIFDVPGIPANGRKTVLFKVALSSKVRPGDQVKQIGALVLSFELLEPSVKHQELVARVVNDSVMKGLASGDDADYTQPNRIVRDKLFFYNAGGLDSAKTNAVYKMPAGLIYEDAYIADLASKKVGQSQKEGSSQITLANGEVKFLLGRRVHGKAGVHVPSGGGGFAVVKLKVDPNPVNRPGAGRSPGEWRAYDAKGQFVPDPHAPSTVTPVRAPRYRTSAPALTASAAPDAAVVSHRHRSTQDSKIFLMVDAPAFARAGQDVTVKLTWGRCADAWVRLDPEDTPDQCYYELPPGFTFKSATRTTSFGVSDEVDYATDRSEGQAPGPVELVKWDANVEPSSVRCASITMTAPLVGGGKHQSGFITFNAAHGTIFAPRHTIRVLRPDENPGDLSTLNFYLDFIGGGAAASLGSATRPNAAFSSLAAGMKETDRNVSITGVDFAQAVGPNVVIIPLGANRMVAAGAGNLISEGGSTMVAAGAGNLVAAGAGNLISLTFAPNDNRTGSNVLASIPSLVAAGGMNLVASGAGNLIGTDGASLIGTDGASLIGLHGASLVGNDGARLIGTDGSSVQYQPATIVGSFRFPAEGGVPQFLAAGGSALDLPFTGANMVAAGAGNLVAAGGGHVLAVGSRGNLIGTDGASLIGTDGASLIGPDGTALIGTDGASLASAPPRLDLFNGNGGALIGTDGASVIPLDLATEKVSGAAALIGTDGASLKLPTNGTLIHGESGQAIPNF